mmetsp:Transcript_619/g.863  ORF Transcript_619/g.863 Transcript_619/m.863 type:complete len:113 (-) Transcript_619:18-356(-)
MQFVGTEGLTATRDSKKLGHCAATAHETGNGCTAHAAPHHTAQHRPLLLPRLTLLDGGVCLLMSQSPPFHCVYRRWRARWTQITFGARPVYPLDHWRYPLCTCKSAMPKELA